MTVPRYSGRHALVDDLLADLTSPSHEPARGNFHKAFSPRTGLSNNGFDEIVVRSVQYTPDDSGRALIARSHRCNGPRIDGRATSPARSPYPPAAYRDMPELDAPCDWHAFEPKLLAWLFAHEFDGDQMPRYSRAAAPVRRFRLYAGIADIPPQTRHHGSHRCRP